MLSWLNRLSISVLGSLKKIRTEWGRELRCVVRTWLLQDWLFLCCVRRNFCFLIMIFIIDVKESRINKFTIRKGWRFAFTQGVSLLLWQMIICLKLFLPTKKTAITYARSLLIAIFYFMLIRKTALINISYRPSPYVIYGFRFIQPRRRQVWAFGSDPELPAPFACRGNGYPQISPIFQKNVFYLWFSRPE